MTVEQEKTQPRIHARVRAEVPGSPYDILVGRDLSSALRDVVAALGQAESVFVVTQASLQDRAAAFASSSGLLNSIRVVLIDEGEGAKSLESVQRLYEELARAGAHRHDAVVAFGGGVVTDVAGFVASTFNRGMTLVNVPTTLLGQVDAAIGGKTGINLAQGKNLVGTIYQPAAVLCDVTLLETLPPEEIASGLAEVVKYGFISDPGLLDVVEERSGELKAAAAKDQDLLADVVTRCASIKARVVAEDEKDSGVRVHLNYGHTFAHAIERTTGYGDIRHGEAVAIGMTAAACLAAELGMLDESIVDRHRNVLTAAGLPVTASLDLEELEAAWRHDKKYRGGVRFVLLEKSASGVAPVAEVEAPREKLMTAIERLAEAK